MRICPISAGRACAPGALISLAITATTTGVVSSAVSLAQAAAAPPVGGAAAADGDAAMERLKDAILRRQSSARRAPMPEALPALPTTGSVTRRSFEGLREPASAPAMESRARNAAAAGREALDREREAMTASLGQALGLVPPDLAAMVRGPVAAPPPQGDSRYVPLLFVSSSMPVAILRTYAAQIERTGGALVFRGMPGGLRRVAPFAKLSAGILRLDPGCEGPACAMRPVQIVVDPIAFRQHGIVRVPALAMTPGDPAQPYCERDEAAPLPTGPVVYGDAALDGLLDEYARQGGAGEVRDAQARLGRR